MLSSFHEEHSYSIASAHIPADMARDFEISLDDYLGTPDEVAVREGSALLLKTNQCISWYKVQCEKVQTIYEKSCQAEPGKYQTSHLSNFYANFNKYISSSEYLKHNEHFNDIQYSHQILTSVMFVIQSNLFKCKAELVVSEDVDFNVFPQHQSSADDDGKLRYIAGYTIAKCRHRLCCSLRNNLFVPGMETKISELNQKIGILDSCIVSASEIVTQTKYPKSLEETHRKQNEREGLTNISDSTFEFFWKLQKIAVDLMSYEALKSKRKYLFKYVHSNVINNTALLEIFEQMCAISFVCTVIDKDCIQELLNCMSVFCSHVMALYEMIVKLFITVLFSQFRKDYLRLVKREKGKALRKKIVQKNEKKASQHVTMDFIKNDMSTDKCISHLKLKADALSDTMFYINFKKAELLLLLKSYNEAITSGSSKKEIGEYLRDILTNPACVNMPNPGILQEQPTLCHDLSNVTVSEPVPGTSTQGYNTSHVSTPSSSMPGISNDENSMELTSSSSMLHVQAEEPDTQEEPRAQRRQSGGLVKSKNSSEKTAVRPCKRKNIKKGKGEGKAKKKQNEVDIESNTDRCCVCSKLYKEGEDWICCDLCALWYHRYCVDLTDDEEWEYYSSENAVYTCPLCQ